MTEVQLRQTYRDKVYNYKPSWILRWGVSFFFLFLLIIVIASGFIKYPDIVPATAEITTINPPVHLVAHVSGKIEQVYKQEGEIVLPNEPIVKLESPAKWHDIQILYEYITVIDSVISDPARKLIPHSEFSSNLELGEIQGNYADLLINYNEFFRFVHSGLFEAEYQSIQEKYRAQKAYLDQLKRKEELLKEQSQFALKEYRRDSLLYEQKVIPEREFEQSHQNILQSKSVLSDMRINMINTTSNLKSLKSDLTKTLLKHKTDKQQLLVKLKQNLGIIDSRIKQWKQNYLLCSPFNGNVSFTTFWSKNQNVNVGEVVVSVVPADSMHVKVRLQFPVKNSGKVKEGQRVNIRLHNYPYQEFGMLTGGLTKISKVPNDLLYSADVELNAGLVTSYGEQLPNVQQLKGDAEILTDDLSLLMRFFNPLRAIIDKRIK